MLINGDCLKEVEKLVNDGIQVDSIVTDPPYHLTSIVERFGKEGSASVKDKDGAFQRQSKGFMGKEWDGGDIAFRKETWEIFMKVLKPGGHLLAFSGSRTYHRMAIAIENAGFDIRDQIMWLYGSGFPKSLNIGKSVDKKQGNKRIKTGQTKTHSNKGMPQAEERTAIGAGSFGQEVEEEITLGTSEWEGWGTALKPAHEPIVLARKPLSEKSIVENVLKHRTGGIHIDACRIEGNDAKYPDTMPDLRDIGKKSKDIMGADVLSFGQIQNAKRKKVVRKSRSEGNVWTNDNSGMDNTKNTFADADPKGRYPSNVMHNGLQEEWSRYFYCPKASKAEKNRGLEDLPIKKTSSMSGRRDSHDMEGYSIDNDVTGRFVTEKQNVHPTVKPVKLMKYLCRLITPKEGTVLDPFMGSGSTGIAAKDEGFDFIGIEKEKEYFEIAERRINTPYKDQINLFDNIDDEGV
jgi:site-specific DNA-methyltransferase (adenine-specific)